MARALANRLQALEDGDVLCVVAGEPPAIDGSLTPPFRCSPQSCCYLWPMPSDDVRTPRNPGLSDHGPGREKYVVDNSSNGSSTELAKRPLNACKLAENGDFCGSAGRPGSASGGFPLTGPAAQFADRSEPRAELRLRISSTAIGELLSPYGGRTGDRQNTVALGRRARRGCDGRARRGLPDSCTRASVVAGASDCTSPSNARERSERRSLMRQRFREDRSVRDAQARDGRSGGTGHVSEVGRCDHALATARELFGEQLRRVASSSLITRRAASAACAGVHGRSPHARRAGVRAVRDAARPARP